MDEVSSEQIRLWADQYLKGTISEEDRQSFERWYNSVPEGTIEWPDLHTASADQLQAKMLQVIQEKIHSGEYGAQHIITGKWKRVMAAAAIILLLGAGAAYWTLTGKEKPEQPGQLVADHQPATDLPPGGDKAVLTLSDGTKLVLDNTGSKQLTDQGSSQLNIDEGLVAYKAVKNIKDQSPTVYNTLTTPRGGQYKLILSDSTKVWLNASSSIRYPTTFSGNDREVTVSGEVYFEVAHNASKPFWVRFSSPGGNGAVKVLGTHFNVSAYKEDAVAKITLLEGAVNVTQGSEQVLLKPGEQAQLKQNGNMGKITGVNVSGETAWISNQFWFDDANIQTVMRDISRWYNIDVQIEGNIPEHFNGYIPRNVTVSKMFEILGQTKLIHFKIADNKTIVVSP